MIGRRHTGLRNRFRNGRSSYSVKGKGRRADRYGAWEQGRQRTPDIIAGHSISYRTTIDLREPTL